MSREAIAAESDRMILVDTSVWVRFLGNQAPYKSSAKKTRLTRERITSGRSRTIPNTSEPSGMILITYSGPQTPEKCTTRLFGMPCCDAQRFPDSTGPALPAGVVSTRVIPRLTWR